MLFKWRALGKCNNIKHLRTVRLLTSRFSVKAAPLVHHACEPCAVCRVPCAVRCERWCERDCAVCWQAPALSVASLCRAWDGRERKTRSESGGSQGGRGGSTAGVIVPSPPPLAAG